MGLKAHLPSVSAKDAAKFVLLPGILPRLRTFGGSGFSYLAFLIASVYQAVRILPASHPYTRPGNIGKFGLRDVIAAAGGHVKLERNNIDQVVIYFAVIAAIAILFLQFAALVLLLFSGQAFAQDFSSASGYSLFKTEFPEKDIAFLLLDHVFGIPELFGSEALKAGGGPGAPTAFHVALHALFQFYNVAILIIAVLIFLYYVVVVVAETAQSGTPFGQRFNTVYAPLRLVIALGMLVPLNYGFNASQYITLYAAKLGSGFATNGWLLFNRDLENPLGADKKSLIAVPEIPKIDNLVEHMAIVHTCMAAYKKLQDYDIKAYHVSGSDIKEIIGPTGGGSNMNYDTAVSRTKGGDIKITFGIIVTNGATGPDDGDGDRGASDEVAPICGEVNVPVAYYDPDYNEDEDGAARISMMMGQVLFNTVKKLLTDDDLKTMAKDLADALYAGPGASESTLKDSAFYKPDSEKIKQIVDKHNTDFAYAVNYNIENHINGIDWSLSEDMKKRGWGGGGIWYNKIAQMNGEMESTLFNLPSATLYPTVLEHILKQKQNSDGGSSKCDTFKPTLADNKPIEFPGKGYDEYYARTMYRMHKGWVCDNTYEQQGPSTNIIWDAIDMIFGVHGLFDMRCTNTDKAHPLAQLTSIGKGLIDSSIRNLAQGMFTAAGGGMVSAIKIFGGDLSAMGKAASGFFVSLATIGLSIGFLLFYILPFMPFLYFFFAVGAWVKEIFEAMVGAPLWALAHIKIDGDGLPGKAASGGYFMILEIFLRPILIVIGLIGGMAIFTASVHILNQIFDTAVLRLTGIDIDSNSMCGTTNPPTSDGQQANIADQLGELDKHVLDEFFFTIIYAIFVYMIAMSCFKMIDLVPNNIMRFLGANVSAFADDVQDPADHLGQYAAISGATIGKNVMTGLTTMSAGGGSAIAGIQDIAQRHGAPPEK